MTRLKKELLRRGIIYSAPDYLRCPEDDMERCLVDIVGDFIITVWYSAVMPEELHLFDRHTLEMVGGQDLYPETTFWGKSRTWHSFAYTDYGYEEGGF